MGAGDRANLLPYYRYFVNHGYRVHSQSGGNLLKYIPITDDSPKKHRCTYRYGFTYTPGLNIPSTEANNGMMSKMFGVHNFNTIHYPGICFNAAEADLIRKRRKSKMVNIYPYTSIREKTINPNIVRHIIQHVKKLGYQVGTSIFDKNKYPWKDLFNNCHLHNSHDYFAREWFVDIAGAQLNICCDGGPINVALASGTQTLGLLTLADATLCQIYPEWQWKVALSTVACSPCFKSANYATHRVNGCVQPKDPCGNHFDLDEICEKIDKLLTQGSPG